MAQFDRSRLQRAEHLGGYQIVKDLAGEMLALGTLIAVLCVPTDVAERSLATAVVNGHPVTATTAEDQAAEQRLALTRSPFRLGAGSVLSQSSLVPLETFRRDVRRTVIGNQGMIILRVHH